MEEGRDRPSEAASAHLMRGDTPGRRNGGGPRSALGGAKLPERRRKARPAAMEEGRDRPSEADRTRHHQERHQAAMEEGRDRPSEAFTSAMAAATPPVPQWRRAEIGPRRFLTHGRTLPGIARRNGGGPRSALGGARIEGCFRRRTAAMEEGRDRPSEVPPPSSRLKDRQTGRNGGGPRSALGGSGEGVRLPEYRVAAMEEGRDRPSEAFVGKATARCRYAAMEEGRDRPSEA